MGRVMRTGAARTGAARTTADRQSTALAPTTADCQYTALSPGVLEVTPLKRRQASGQEVHGRPGHGRGCELCARISRVYRRRCGRGFCERVALSRMHLVERVALSRMHLYSVHIVRLVSAV